MPDRHSSDRLLIKAHCIMKAIIDELPHRKSPLARNGALKAIDQRHTLHDKDTTANGLYTADPTSKLVVSEPETPSKLAHGS